MIYIIFVVRGLPYFKVLLLGKRHAAIWGANEWSLLPFCSPIPQTDALVVVVVVDRGGGGG